MSPRAREAWGVLGLLALLVLASNALRPLMMPDEGRYAQVAREMLAGHSLTPTLYGLPYFHKPPLLYLIDALAMQVFGVSAWAVRVGPALGAWCMGAALWWDQRARHGAPHATRTLVLLATTPFFFVGAQFVNHDMLVAGTLTVAILCGRRAIEATDGRAWRWALATGAAAGLAMLAKGLIGFVLPGLVLLPWALVTRADRWAALGRLLHPAAWLAFAAVAGPWYVQMARQHPAFLDYFFMEQHVRRFASAGFNNAQPFVFYVPVLAVALLPWTLWAWAAWRAARDTPAAAPSESGFMLWWAVGVVGFFSLPQSKLVGYVLPALPPLAVLLARGLGRVPVWRATAALALGLNLGLVLAAVNHTPRSLHDLAQTLRAQRAPGEDVVLVDLPGFDLSFDAALERPPWILGPWGEAEVDAHDDWHKELQDAARRFATPEAATVLWPQSRQTALACAPGVRWWVAPPEWQPPADPASFRVVQRGRHAVLWRSEGGAATVGGGGCSG